MDTSRISAADASAVEQAVACLDRGGLVALPTETVYGLAADASNGSAVAKIFEAKGRPSFNPLIVHVSTLAMAEAVADFDQLSRHLAQRFWPGPLTLVLGAGHRGAVHPLVAAGLPTLAVRAPSGLAHDVVARLGRPVAAPSANRSGKVSATTADHVMTQLGGRIDLVLDGGATPIGVESTIVKVEAARLVLLRAGGIGAEELAEAASLPVVASENSAAIQSPGQLASHYAPRGAVRLNARNVWPGEVLIKFGPGALAGEDAARAVINLSSAGDLREAASRLFAALFEFDREDISRIAVGEIPEHGLGQAINDRLRRAAAPRP